MRRAIISAFVGVLAAGCQEEPGSWTDDYSFVREGQHVTVYGYGRDEGEVCGGSFEALDTHAAAILEFIGSDASVHYSYRWMSEDVFEGRCPPGASACTASGEPYSRSIPDLHESTHAIFYTAWDNACPSFLSEGLAEYFSSPRRGADEAPDPSLLPDVLTGAPIEIGDEYDLAGHFTSFLIEDYGVDAVRGLCEAIPFENSRADWELAVSEVIGGELDQLLAAYESYPTCTQHQYRARLWECAGEPDVTYNGEPELTFELVAACADERVLGPIGGWAIVTRRVWFPEDQLASVTTVSDSGSIPLTTFMSQECAPCSAEPQVFVNDGQPPIFPFNAGMHEFIFFVEPDAEEPLTVRISQP